MIHPSSPSPRFRLQAKDLWWLIAVLACILISRLLLMESSPSSWDAASFFCAATDFNIAEDRPHLPGYFLHVLLIRFFRFFLHPYSANVAPSLLWSALCAIPLFALVRRSLSLRSSLMFVTFVLTNPMLWFYGCVSEIYAFDAFFSVVIVLLSLSPRTTTALFITMALGAGVRQSSAALMLPLVVWRVMYHYRSGTLRPLSLLYSVLLGAGSLALWTVPFLLSCGGIAGYISLYSTHPPGAVVSPLSNIVSMVQHGVYALLIPCALLLWQGRVHKREKHEGAKQTTASVNYITPILTSTELMLWLVPALVMFLFTTYTKGYFLIITAVPAIALLRYREDVVARMFMVGIILQTLMFVGTPHTMPGMDLVMAPHHGVSKWRKALERTTSVFSMTRARLLHEREYIEQTHELLKLTQSPSVFVDPAYPLTARSLQTVDPHRELCMQYTYEANSVLVHKGISQYREQGIEQRLRRSVILTTTEVCAAQPLLHMLAVSNGLVVARVDSVSASMVARWYDTMYAR